MSIRKTPFTNGEYYHVFNRGVDKRDIFTTQDELYFFLNRLLVLNNMNTSYASSYIRNKSKNVLLEHNDQLVKIVAYCLLPNHFHLVLKQIQDNGISKFMQRLGSSYVTLFNEKHKRSGALFQGRFKAKHIEGEYGLPILSSYVNLNFKHHQINPKKQLVKSSIFEYLKTELGEYICDKNEVKDIINETGGLDMYKSFARQASIQFANNKNIKLTDKEI